MEKIKDKSSCPKCGVECDHELWRSNGRLYETLKCVECMEELGRIDAGQWHLLAGAVRRRPSVSLAGKRRGTVLKG